MSAKMDDMDDLKNPDITEPNATGDGVFTRPNFAKTVIPLIGNNVKVKTKSGSTYEGVLSSLTSDSKVVIDRSDDVGGDETSDDRIKKGTVVFKPEEILSISCVNVNLEDALDMSQRLEYPGSGWNEGRQDASTYDKGWQDLLRSNKEIYEHSEYSDDLSFSSVYRQSTFGKNPLVNNVKYDGDYAKPRILPDGSTSGNFREAIEKTSTLNPYAKPFTPMTPQKDCQEPLAVLLPTYVVPNNTPTKLDATNISGVGGTSLVSSGLHHNHYAEYPFDYDDKLYSPYDNLPIPSHEYQHYYPHLQYIQYFRRFY